MTRVERWLALGAPAAAMATVAVGLELGAREGARAAMVYGSAAARGSPGIAWQVVAAAEKGSFREGLAGAALEIVARASGPSVTWQGTTNDDGVAEPFLVLTGSGPVRIEVRSGGEILAQGEAAPPPPQPPSPSRAPWAPFARREGPIKIDVAVLGERVAPSVAASVWVRARDGATQAPVVGADVAPEADSSLTSVSPHARTDSRGWAEIAVVPAGLAVSFAVDVHASDGRAGTWIGGLVASPGAARVATRSRWSPEEAVGVSVVAPPTRATEYVEIDGLTGRAWAASIDLAHASDGTATGEATGPRLGPGIYWAVASGDPAGAAGLEPGSSVRPFFVAGSDEEALRFGPDPDACAPSHDVRETSRAVDTCLALAVANPVQRWVALDGFAARRGRDGQRRGRGLAIALAGVAAAVLLEGALLLRAAAGAGAAAGGVPVERRRFTLAVALLTGLLGFALLAAFLVRLS